MIDINDLKKMFQNKKDGLCPVCGSRVDFNDFCDDISIKEYCISGLCQLCQDTIFGKP